MRLFLIMLILSLFVQPFAYAGTASPKPDTEISFDKKEIKKKLKRYKRNIHRQKRDIDPEKQGILSFRILLGGLGMLLLGFVAFSAFVAPAIGGTITIIGLLGIAVGGIMSMFAVPRMQKAGLDKSSRSFRLATLARTIGLVFISLVGLSLIASSLISYGG